MGVLSNRGGVGEGPTSLQAEYKPDFERMVKDKSVKKKKADDFLKAIYVYQENRHGATEPLAMLIGELELESRGLAREISYLIKQIEKSA